MIQNRNGNRHQWSGVSTCRYLAGNEKKLELLKAVDGDVIHNDWIEYDFNSGWNDNIVK